MHFFGLFFFFSVPLTLRLNSHPSEGGGCEAAVSETSESGEFKSSSGGSGGKLSSVALGESRKLSSRIVEMAFSNEPSVDIGRDRSPKESETSKIKFY